MKSGPRWEQARELFLELAESSAERRQRRLEELAAGDPELAEWLRNLLRHDVGEVGPGPATESRRFGSYELVRHIGSGGMGEVFVARRADGEYEREVAIKLLRGGAPDQEVVRRFLRERQTLASLDHEYIARMIDGGTTPAGEPYLVMEYIEGIPADEFAARLELRERLELFVRIGQAVAHAHERGFVHRDLKPSNILVRPDGTPRLLDFGIARPDRAAHSEAPGEETLTRTGHRLFTPAYASPEQVRGELATPQSDLFALGVVLYVFLCGETPWSNSASLFTLERSICEDEPKPPSRIVTGTTRMRIAGDLDAIVLQCLAKRPEQRYASALELCDDVERHLAGLTVHARRVGTLVRSMRFARRRPAYPIGIGLLLVALAAAWLAWDTERRGEHHREELVTAVSDRITAARSRWADGELESAEVELAAALNALDELPGELGLKAQVLVQQAVFASLQRDWSASLERIVQARSLLDQLEQPDPEVVATLLNTHAYVLHRTDPGEGSREAGFAALSFAREHLEVGDVLRVDALLGWADELRREGQPQNALAIVGEAVTETRRRDPKGETLSRMLNEQAVALAGARRPAEAVECYREALEILSWHRGERHPAPAKVRLNLGTTLFLMGRLEEAKAEFESSLTTCRYLELDSFIASNLHFIGRIELARAELEAAEEAALEALAIREDLDLGVHTDRSRCLLGIVQARMDRPGEALETLGPLLSPSQPGQFLPEMEAEAQHLLGAIQQDAGDGDAARPHLERALDLKRARFGPAHPDCQDLSRRLARLR